ncbi:MAG TPA: plastocyanin/azurin family copper-binding protein [Solirubrobacterales bacterium]|jgi:uncharacterized cupredoxin-like copper-binding protein
MRISLHRTLVPLALLAVAAILIAGCGGDDGTTTTEAKTTAAAGGGAGATLTIKMGDFYFAPKNATAQAGKTTIEAPNEGSVEHELVVFKTNMNPANLPTEANGEVDEKKLEQEGAEELGEIEEVEPGETGSKEFNLTPGKYVMICNLPGHYAQGMYGSLTVE